MNGRSQPDSKGRPLIEILALALPHPNLDFDMTVRAWDFGGAMPSPVVLTYIVDDLLVGQAHGHPVHIPRLRGPDDVRGDRFPSGARRTSAAASGSPATAPSRRSRTATNRAPQTVTGQQPSPG